MQLISHTIKLQLFIESVTTKKSKCLYSCWSNFRLIQLKPFPTHWRVFYFASFCCTLLTEGKDTSRASIGKQVRIAGVMLAQLHTVTESFCWPSRTRTKTSPEKQTTLPPSQLAVHHGYRQKLSTIHMSRPFASNTSYCVCCRALQCYVKRATLELNQVPPTWMRCFRKCCSE